MPFRRLLKRILLWLREGGMRHPNVPVVRVPEPRKRKAHPE